MPVKSFEPINPAADVTTTRTYLHEVVPVTGSIVSGTYSDNNIKNYTHGMFQSVYDYPYLSSSANHIFDLTMGIAGTSAISGAANVQGSKKINIYNQFAQTLLGFTGSTNDIRAFESDLVLDQTGSMKEVFFVSFSRLLTKDEIKKNTFSITLGGGAYGTAFDYSKATATFVGTAALNGADGTNIVLTNTDGSTVTFHTDPTKNFGDTSSDGGDHTWEVNTGGISGGSEVRKATQAFHIACLAAIAAGELDMTAVPATDTGTQTSFTLTQTTAGHAGNTAITLVTGVTANGETAFAGGGNDALTLQDANARINGDGVNNADGGDYGVLFSNSAGTGDGLGVVFYQAGIAVITASAFGGIADFAKHPSKGNQTTTQAFTGSSMTGSIEAFRRRIQNISLNNTTEINSTIYFCRAPSNKFNYSSNPTYVTGSKIRVKSIASDNPVAYVTTVGLYNSSNELLAVAKLSEPLKKSVDNELTIRVRLDY